MRTEEQAREKWCPYSRYNPNNEGGGGNRFWGMDGVHDHCRCIASDCMAWRWLTHENRDQIWRPTGPDTAQSTDAHMGYCGLAGKP